ncbi:hypothetical protein Taro_050484 [Colocasia esculenta]|uniref:F-box domain-containing protein n=1 Tax=Colocasia esculenta TaxID=4460 RepID=A0A843XE07_COLES|nr:hypothetical protein [Colocasia esculenta]
MERWPGLPPDVLASIMARLDLVDQVRMSAVCAGWRLVAMDSSRRPPPLPALWLLLPQRCNAAAPPLFEFASFSEGMRRYAIGRAPGLRYGDCIGSSEGWLMVVDALGGLHAVDPITGVRIPLLSDGIVLTEGDSAAAPVYRYRRSIFVPPRGSGGGSAVAAAVIRLRDAEFPELTFARAGVNAAWVSPEVAFPGFEDIAAHDGKLYALSSDSRVVVFDLGSDPSSSAPPAVSVIQTEPDRRRFQRKHLGVMAGNLVMLQWRYCGPCPFRLRRCIPEFQVLRLQRGPEPKWVELKDLGGHAILLGTDGFTAVHTGEFPELRSNCVYSLVQASDDDGGGSVLEVVELQSRAVAVEPLCETSAAPIWFLPIRNSFSAPWINWQPAKLSPMLAGKL